MLFLSGASLISVFATVSSLVQVIISNEMRGRVMSVYNVAFRTHDQELPYLNFWSDAAQAKALTSGDVSEFAVVVDWDELAERQTTPEPVITEVGDNETADKPRRSGWWSRRFAGG